MHSKFRVADLLIVLVPLAVIVGAIVLLASSPRVQLAGTGSIAPATPWLTIADTATLERVAFGSCLDQAYPEPIWNAVIAAKPQLFLMMGDMVYGDVTNLEDPAIPELRRAYRVQARQAELARARAAFPFLAIWDDHDYGLNDAGGEFPLKQATLSAFREFWQLEAPQQHEGLYHSRIIGPAGKRVQLIFLDNRWFRSTLKRKTAMERAASAVRGPYAPDDSAEKTMLGPEQWAWLEGELKKPAEIRLLVSSVQTIATGHALEHWGNFPKERERLFQLLKRSGAKGLMVLSGDRHWAAIYAEDDALAYRLIEVTASALNKPAPATDSPEPARISDAYNAPNFGLLEIDWAGRRLKATINGVTEKDVLAIEVPFAKLGL